MISQRAEVTFGAWVGKRGLHNERAVFRRPYDRRFRSEDMSLIDYMATFRPCGCGCSYTAVRLDLSQISERQFLLMIMDDVALDAVESGKSIKMIRSQSIGETAMTNYMRAACHITGAGLKSADLSEGCRLGETLLEVSMDQFGSVRVQDVSPHGTDVYANWELAFDESAAAVRAV